MARCYADPGIRSSVDLDLVVSPAALEQVLEALERYGFELLDGNWPLLREADLHEVTLRSAAGGALDLYWSLGPSPTSIDTSPRVDVLLSRAVEFDAGGLRTRGLGDFDALVRLPCTRLPQEGTDWSGSRTCERLSRPPSPTRRPCTRWRRSRVRSWRWT